MSKNKYKWSIGGAPPFLEPHSEAKHALFRQYLRAYIDKLTVTPQQRALRFSIVDGFCGGGIYRAEDGLVSGSPLLLLEEIAAARVDLQSSGRPNFGLEVDFWFVDENRDACAHLDDVIKKSSFADLLTDGRIRILKSSFEGACEPILSELRGRRGSQRALFFLDQYGYNDVAIMRIKKILAEFSNVEIVLTFAVDALLNYLQDSDRFLKAVTPVGLSRDDVITLKEIMESSEAGSRYVAQNALYQHIFKLTEAKYQSPFFVKSADSKRAYWLLHFSGHHTARDVMGEIHWGLGNGSVHYGGEGLFSLGFDGALAAPSFQFDFTETARRKSVALVERQVPRFVVDKVRALGGPITLDELFSGVCNDTPATRDLIEKVLVDLRDAKELRILGLDGKEKPRSLTVDWRDRLDAPPAPTFLGPWGPRKD